MFRTTDPTELCEVIDAFQVPMFVAEESQKGHFHLLAINDAHTRTTDLSREGLWKTPITDVLPKKEARVVEARYSACSRSKRPLSYRETLTINGRRQRWNTTLLPVESTDGVTRVIGTAILTDMIATPRRTRRVFEDINYFSAQSAFQLSRVSAYLDELSRNDRPEGLRRDIGILSGLCRSIDQTLGEIRKIAEPRRGAASGTGGYLIGPHEIDPATADGSPPKPRKSFAKLTGMLGALH